MNKTGIIIGIIVIAIIAVGGFVLVSGGDDNKPPTQNTNTPANNDQQNTPKDDDNTSQPIQPPSTATITYTDEGFSPSQVTVKAGAKITVKNDSSGELQFSSDVHPVHTDNPELNTSLIAPDQSTTFTANTAGTWGFHNHQRDSDQGTLIVQ